MFFAYLCRLGSQLIFPIRMVGKDSDNHIIILSSHRSVFAGARSPCLPGAVHLPYCLLLGWPYLGN